MIVPAFLRRLYRNAQHSSLPINPAASCFFFLPAWRESLPLLPRRWFATQIASAPREVFQHGSALRRCAQLVAMSSIATKLCVFFTIVLVEKPLLPKVAFRSAEVALFPRLSLPSKPPFCSLRNPICQANHCEALVATYLIKKSCDASLPPTKPDFMPRCSPARGWHAVRLFAAATTSSTNCQGTQNRTRVQLCRQESWCNK